MGNFGWWKDGGKILFNVVFVVMEHSRDCLLFPASPVLTSWDAQCCVLFQFQTFFHFAEGGRFGLVIVGDIDKAVTYKGG